MYKNKFGQLILIFVLIGISPVYAQIEILLIDGQTAPGDTRSISFSTSNLVALEGKYAAVATTLSNGVGLDTTHVLYLAEKNGPIIKLAEEGEPITPTRNINRMSFSSNFAGPVPSVIGDVAVPVTSVLSSNPNAARSELLLRSGSGQNALVVSEEQAEPTGDGQFFIRTALAPAINTSGLVAVSASLFATSGGSSDDEGIYRWDPQTGQLLQVVRKGQTIPNGPGTFTGRQFQASQAFDSPRMDETGNIVFYAQIVGSGTSSDAGLYLGDGTQITELMRYLAPLPGGDDFGRAGGYDINSSGEIAVSVNWAFTSSSFDGIYSITGNAISLIAKRGDIAPGGGTYRNMEQSVRLDDQGQAVFSTNLTTDDGILDALFVGDASAVTLIARDGSPAPNNRGNFVSFDRWTSSKNGNIAFQANTDTGRGIYRFRNGTLTEIAHTGDALEGSTITALLATGQSFGQARGVNNDGDVAFIFTLADGRSGVAAFATDSSPDAAAVMIPMLPGGWLTALLGAVLLISRAGFLGFLGHPQNR